MNATYILVDFENVQPGAADVALVRGEHLRLWIFRGPSQKKYPADLAEAWQPLGDRVQFIRCEKAGRNALDMHIAFQLGRLLGEHEHEAGLALRSARFVVVSKDTDYDPLLQYIRALGCAATRVPNIRAALGGAAEQPAHKPPKLKPVKAGAEKPAAEKPAVRGRKSAAAKKAPPAKKTRTAAAAKSTKPSHAAPSPEKAAADLVEKAIKHLREHPKSRPAKRKSFEKNIESILRKKIEPKAVPALVDALAARGVIAITGNKIDYPLWGDREK
jgi:hypothetical protein